MDFAPVTLEGRHIRLEPLSLAHAAGLCAVGFDDSICAGIRGRRSARRHAALRRVGAGGSRRGPRIAFRHTRPGDRPAIGSSRFHGPDHESRHIEIGYTWLAPAWQRTAANTEAKLLMLQHAFEAWRCIRVELKTDSLNAKSRNAILRLGAKEEGTFRNHVITHSGRIRHSVFFSILDSEWPTVKANLKAKLERDGGGSIGSLSWILAPSEK